MVTGTVCFKQTKNNICNGLGEHPKNGTPYLFLQRLKVAIGTQLGFGEYVTITSLVPNLTGASWATGAPQRPRCRNLEGRFCTLGPRCDSHTSFKMKRSNVTVTRPINADTHRVSYLPNVKAYELLTWYTDGGRRPATGTKTSKVKGQGRMVT